MSDYVMIPVKEPVKKFIEGLGSKGETYQDILIRLVPGLREHLKEIGFLKKNDHSPGKFGATSIPDKITATGT